MEADVVPGRDASLGGGGCLGGQGALTQWWCAGGRDGERRGRARWEGGATVRDTTHEGWR